jgi:DMSO/TMAO reductase YedYZ molybdopterin-dependent catalytic subunit
MSNLTPRLINRRLMLGSLVGAGGTLLSGCDALGNSETFRDVLALGEKGNFAIQRAFSDRAALAPEYAPEQMSPVFRANGTRLPPGDAYARHMADGFRDWRLVVDGLVAKPLSLSLDQIKSAPRRTQITRHDCVEGWSAIGKWTGLPLKLILDAAGFSTRARFLVFHCADTLSGKRYYESIDLIDALHPQTMLAWALNDAALPIANGAPLRLRVERQLGYKHAKYVERIEAVADLAGVYGGQGGFWEEKGYQWYAGI